MEEIWTKSHVFKIPFTQVCSPRQNPFHVLQTKTKSPSCFADQDKIPFMFCRPRQNPLYVLQTKTKSPSCFADQDKIPFMFCRPRQNPLHVLQTKTKSPSCFADQDKIPFHHFVQICKIMKEILYGSAQTHGDFVLVCKFELI